MGRKRELVKATDAALHEAVPFPDDVRIVLREWPLDGASRNGLLGSEPARPVFILHTAVADTYRLPDAGQRRQCVHPSALAWPIASATCCGCRCRCRRRTSRSSSRLRPARRVAVYRYPRVDAGRPRRRRRIRSAASPGRAPGPTVCCRRRSGALCGAGPDRYRESRGCQQIGRLASGWPAGHACRRA